MAELDEQKLWDLYYSFGDGPTPTKAQKRFLTHLAYKYERYMPCYLRGNLIGVGTPYDTWMCVKCTTGVDIPEDITVDCKNRCGDPCENVYCDDCVDTYMCSICKTCNECAINCVQIECPNIECRHLIHSADIRTDTGVNTIYHCPKCNTMYDSSIEDYISSSDSDE